MMVPAKIIQSLKMANQKQNEATQLAEHKKVDRAVTGTVLRGSAVYTWTDAHMTMRVNNLSGPTRVAVKSSGEREGGCRGAWTQRSREAVCHMTTKVT